MRTILFACLLCGFFHNSGIAQPITKVTLEFKTTIDPKEANDNDVVEIRYLTASNILIAQDQFKIKDLSASASVKKELTISYKDAVFDHVKNSRVTVTLLSYNEKIHKWSFDMDLFVESGSTHVYAFHGGTISLESRNYTANVN